MSAASNVKQLSLTHISGRYTGDEILAEATAIFPNSRVTADLDWIVI
jgi:ribonuclease Z